MSVDTELFLTKVIVVLTLAGIWYGSETYRYYYKDYQYLLSEKGTLYDKEVFSCREGLMWRNSNNTIISNDDKELAYCRPHVYLLTDSEVEEYNNIGRLPPDETRYSGSGMVRLK